MTYQKSLSIGKALTELQCSACMLCAALICASAVLSPFFILFVFPAGPLIIWLCNRSRSIRALRTSMGELSHDQCMALLKQYGSMNRAGLQSSSSVTPHFHPLESTSLSWWLVHLTLNYIVRNRSAEKRRPSSKLFSSAGPEDDLNAEDLARAVYIIRGSAWLTNSKTTKALRICMLIAVLLLIQTFMAPNIYIILVAGVGSICSFILLVMALLEVS